MKTADVNVSFQEHVAVLGQFLDRRQEIVDAIERNLLNVREKPISRSRNRSHFDAILHSCFFDLPGLSRDLARLKGQLASRHRADGFEPLLIDNYSHELDPLLLVIRAYDHWDTHRWPGKSGRLTYGGSIYAVFVLRQLEYLSLRIWDDGHARAADRLQEIQRLLDRLNDAAAPTGFVRDARWLIHTAQGPLTRALGPYFRIAEQISASFTGPHRLELHKASARMIGGHLRSQLRYRVWNTGKPIGDPETLAFTRNSNSMDSALLAGDLVPLLEAYREARSDGDSEGRLDLADAILQGLSADPGLFLARLDLLCPSTMIEDLCVGRGDNGQARYTAMGDAHLELLGRYGELVGELAESLRDDAVTFDPSNNVYSPYGIAYGFVGDILSNIALSTLHSQPSFGLGLEDVFVGQGALEQKLARARGWQALPKREGEREHFDHSVEWAQQMFGRLLGALHTRAAHRAEPNASSVSSARLFVVPESGSVEALPEGFLPAGIVRAEEHCFTSDVKRALATSAIGCPADEMSTLRNEGRFLASSEADGVWFGISKVVLTLILGQGKDALVDHIPRPAIDVLQLTCPGLVVVGDSSQ